MRLFGSQAKPDHILCRMDARVKIISALALLVMVISCKGALFPLVVCALGIAACFSMGIRVKTLLLRFSEPLLIIFVVMVLKLFFSGGSTPLFSFPLFSITITASAEGLREGVRIGCRIIGAVSVVAVLGFSTPFNQFMAGLSWMRIPRGFVEVSMFAYRYIFMLFDDAMVIYNAQKNRLGYSTMKRGLASFGVLAGSLVLKAFENSQSTAIAMTQRGYDGNMPHLEHQSFRLAEVAASAAFIIFMGVIFIWKM